MGTAASNKKVTQYDTIRQLPTIDPLRRQPPLQPTQRVPNSLPRSPTIHKSQHKSRQQDEIMWPLPPNEYDGKFKAAWPEDEKRYSLKRAYDAKLPQISEWTATTTTTTRITKSDSKETSTSQWNKVNSCIYDSAHVQSTLTAQSHSLINLSTAEEVSKLMVNLNNAHRRLDGIVKDRLQIISKETEMIIGQITTDTHDIQLSLLSFAKARQSQQDELYREWLQKYVVILDGWKSARLAKLQEELQEYQRAIITYSQRRISSVNTEANKIKSLILREEQEKASLEINALMAQIESLSTHQILQHIGSETMTNMNLTILANVGRKMPGQGAAFDFDQHGTIGGKQDGTVIQPMDRHPPKPHTYDKVQVNAIKARAIVRNKSEQSEARTSESEDDDNSQ
ncbi:unnamed protein product [Rotaria sp. Silwood2]|nr:unnamed protein product [Rotaria sp. Silwood2]